MPRSCLSIILAAGDGTRMRSSRSKVLHEVAGLSMIRHVVRAASKAGSSKVAVVLGRDSDAVEKAVRLDAADAALAHQRERLGTGHAVLAAREALAEGFDDVVVLFGDTPLIRPETLARARAALIAGADLCVVGFRAADPTGYGRLLVDANGELTAIREEKDASDVERAIDFCNAGVMAFKGENALPMLEKIGNDNAKGEYYLTDLVAIAREAGRSVKAIEAGAEEVLGVNTRLELAVVEGLWQARRRQEAMLSGVTLIDPESTFFAFDTEIASDVLVEPNVVFAPGVTVDSEAVIHAFSYLEGCRVESGATVGPFARLRPGAHLHAEAKVGNFCEVKNAEIHAGAKINHLTYIGDASVGARANIGAGTITCNYDGALKHHTEIGADAFVGSNSALVAPVRIGEKAYVASGSVVTEDVPDGALAIARGRQENKDGRGIAIAERNARAKADKAASRKA